MYLISWWKRRRSNFRRNGLIGQGILCMAISILPESCPPPQYAKAPFLWNTQFPALSIRTLLELSPGIPLFTARFQRRLVASSAPGLKGTGGKPRRMPYVDPL